LDERFKKSASRWRLLGKARKGKKKNISERSKLKRNHLSGSHNGIGRQLQDIDSNPTLVRLPSGPGTDCGTFEFPIQTKGCEREGDRGGWEKVEAGLFKSRHHAGLDRSLEAAGRKARGKNVLQGVLCKGRVGPKLAGLRQASEGAILGN